MNWAEPSWLYGTVLVLPLLLVVLGTGWWHRKRLAGAFGPGLLERVLPTGVRRRRTIRDVCALSCIALGLVAMAEPSFDKEIVKVKARGVDLVIALDLSRSMDAEDVDPSRLERARREIVDLLAILEGDRVGVVLFAGQAIGRMPLTNDLKAIQWVLDDVSTEMFRAQGSDLGAALDVSRDLLSRDEGKAGRAIVVFSDGETHEPDNARRAAEDCAAAHIAVYTVGIGDAPAPVPSPAGGVLRYQGEPVTTVPDFTVLQEVARTTGGGHVKSEATAADMEALYRQGIRQQVVAVERDTQQQEKWRTAYQVPLGVGIGLWLFGAWIGEGRRPFGAAAAALLALSLATGTARAATPAEADALYRAEDYRGAARAFEELVLERPGSADLYERLGAARYRMGDWLGAASAYDQASRLRGGDADDDFAAANARWRAGQLQEALNGYDRALGRDPSHERAQTNRELLAGEMQGRLVEKPPPPPQNGSSEDEDGEGSGESDEQKPEPKPGEQGEDPKDGSADEGQDGTPDTEQQGDPSQQGDPGQQRKPGQDPSQDPSDGEDPDGDPSDAVSPDELDGASDDPSDGEGSTGQPDGVGEAAGNITPAQADRLLDGVEEGRQRVQMVGRSSARPW